MFGVYRGIVKILCLSPYLPPFQVLGARKGYAMVVLYYKSVHLFKGDLILVPAWELETKTEKKKKGKKKKKKQRPCFEEFFPLDKIFFV